MKIIYNQSLKKLIDNWIEISNKYFILIIANSKKYKLLDESIKYLKNINKWNIEEIIKINNKANINNYESLKDWEYLIVYKK